MVPNPELPAIFGGDAGIYPVGNVDYLLHRAGRQVALVEGERPAEQAVFWPLLVAAWARRK